MEVIINYEMGDLVSLPLNETGKLIQILPLPWGYKYKVRLIKANEMFTHKTKQIHLFKYEDLKPIEKLKEEEFNINKRKICKNGKTN